MATLPNPVLMVLLAGLTGFLRSPSYRPLLGSLLPAPGSLLDGGARRAWKSAHGS